MKNLSIFQLVLLAVFGAFLLGGFVVVAMYSSKNSGVNNQPINVTIWGTLNSSEVKAAIGGSVPGTNIALFYIQKNVSTFENEIVEAIATGKGPDIVILPIGSIAANRNKTLLIPYEIFPAREFKNTFIEESDLLMATNGLIGVPFTVDPLVMYWNRDIFTRAGIANPPVYWDEFLLLAQRLTKKDASGAITQSAVGVGEYANITHAKEILSALLLQSGNKIATWNDEFTFSVVRLSGTSLKPESVLSFYTQFADERKNVHTWSRALTDSKSMFLGNRLGVYFGFASELSDLKYKSPNLNFDVALFPQSRNGPVVGTFGRLYSFLILQTARDKNAAAEVIKTLTEKGVVENFADLAKLPSVRRDYRPEAKDPFISVFAQSALVSLGWIDPSTIQSDFIFREMIESVTSGFLSAQDAIGKAEQQLLRFIREKNK